MTLPPADLAYVKERFEELAGQVEDASDASGSGATPVQLVEAMGGLLDLLQRQQAGGQLKDAQELTALGGYALHLLDELAALAEHAARSDLRREVEQLALALALWVARNGGELRQLSAVVNAIAQLANGSRQPPLMAKLYTCCCELVEAASVAFEDRGGAEPRDPWRLLLLNRAIVATRSHNPELISAAYDAIIELLPADAEQFFAEGMEQMAVIDYPDHVREIVKRYFLAHARPKRLH